MEELIAYIFLIVLLMLSGFFSSSETALFSLSSTKVKAYRTSDDGTSRLIAQLLDKPKDLLVTIFMLNTLVNILVQNVTSSLSGPDGGWGFKVVLPFVLLVFLGEIIPKYVGLQRNVTVAHLTVRGVNFFQNLLEPIRRWTVAITAPVSRAMFFYLSREKSISRDELKHVLKTSQEHGVLDPQEAELAWGYINLQDASVREVMRPREDMLYYNVHDPISKLQYLLIDQEVTRVPVCDRDLEHVLGIMSANTFFLHQADLMDKEVDLKPYLSRAEFVPESMDAKVLLRRLEEKNAEMALVVDEYGAIAGLITYEDLVEVLIGEINDLRDKGALYTRAGKNEIIANGKMELAEFNELFDVELESLNNMVTIGGWLTERLGTIPKSGVKCEFDGFIFHVLSAEPTHIRKLYIRKLVKQ